MNKPRHLGLFEGIGGFSLAAHWAGYETVAWCEWNPFCQKVLQYYFPNAEGFGDITQSDFYHYANSIDLLTAGFPCQPVSHAGNRKGTDDERWGWPETLRVIKQVQPKCVILENVAGLISILESARETVLETKTLHFHGASYDTTNVSNAKRVLGTIVADLQAAGYELPTLADGTPIVLCVPACAVNAPHRRDRVWIVAYARYHAAEPPRNSRSDEGSQSTTVHPTRQSGNGSAIFNRRFCHLQGITPHAKSHGDFGDAGELRSSQKIADRQGAGNEPIGSGSNATHTNGLERRQQLQLCRSYGAWTWPKSCWSSKKYAPYSLSFGQEQRRTQIAGLRPELARKCATNIKAVPSDFRAFPTQSAICSGNDGIPARLVGIAVLSHRNESIRAYGNAIVPEVAYEIIKTINYQNNV